jgi:hypothetical protein
MWALPLTWRENSRTTDRLTGRPGGEPTTDSLDH